jgi:hypothetical protein
MYNLFLVQTPFQLFNSIEAKNRFHKDEKNILIVINKGNEKNLNQITEIINYDTHWDEIIQIDFITMWQRIFYPISIKSKINKWNGLKVSTIYVALYRNISAHIVNNVNHKKTIIYDDGNSMFKTVKFLNEKKKKSFSFLRELKDRLLLRNTKIDFLYQSTLFTLFDITSFQNIENRVIKNDFSYFKSKIKSLKKEKNIFFIGSKMIDNGITKETFEVALKIVIKFYEKSNKEVYYVPHRYEDLEYLEKLAKKFNFTLMPFSSIIEFEFIRKGIDPYEVATFRSTAVDTLKIIYDTNIQIFSLPLEHISEKKREEFNLVYQNFIKKMYKIEEIECV